MNGIELRVVFEVTKIETNYTVNKESYAIQVPLKTQIRDTANYIYQVVIFISSSWNRSLIESILV